MRPLNRPHNPKQEKDQMTKQHFIALAAEIKQISNIEARAEAARAVAAVARQFNPRFDWMKFCAACGV
jgi:hypothetical protein